MTDTIEVLKMYQAKTEKYTDLTEFDINEMFYVYDEFNEDNEITETDILDNIYRYNNIIPIKVDNDKPLADQEIEDYDYYDMITTTNYYFLLIG